MISPKVAHVVGNGPSWIDFKKIADTDFVIGCNATKVKEANVTMMSDVALCNQVVHLRKWERVGDIVDVPVIANHHIVDWVNISEETAQYIKIYGIYRRPDDIGPLEMSSAHYGVIWAIDNGYDEIHVWGVDSYFQGHINSYTDTIRPSHMKKDAEKVARVAERWKLEWDTLIAKYNNIRIILHAPTFIK